MIKDRNIEIRIIDETHFSNINIPNESFPLRGRMLITYNGNKWEHTEELFEPEQITEMTFPDEDYVFSDMKDYIFIGAYDGEECVGLAILMSAFNPCLYLYDLKVKKSMRRNGIGRMMIDASITYALNKNYKELYTVGQDNNPNACLLYLSCGFEIRGLDMAIYENTKQAGKSDIYFYKRSL